MALATRCEVFYRKHGQLLSMYLMRELFGLSCADEQYMQFPTFLLISLNRTDSEYQ